MKQILVPLFVGLVSLFVGLSFGGRNSPSSKDDPAKRQRDSSAVKTSQVRTGSRVAGGSLARSLLSGYSTQELASLARDESAKNLSAQDSVFTQLAYTEWSLRDPEGALAFAQEEGSRRWVSHCIGIYGRSAPDSALAWIDQNVSDLRDKNSLVLAVYQGLVKENPTDAVARLEVLPQGPLRDQMLHSVVGQWAEQDVSQVFNWIESQEPSAALGEMYQLAMNKYISQSPKEAIAVIDEMYDNNEKPGFANQAAYHLAKTDREKALAWAETLNTEQRHAALMGIMEQWGGQSENSLEALSYVRSLPALENKELFEMVTARMSRSVPDTLAKELPKMTEGQQRLVAAQLAQVYSINKPDEVVSWLDSLETSAVRDAAVQTALNVFRNVDVNQAFDLSVTIDNYNLRRDEMQRTLLQWVPVDPDAAFKALYNSGLPKDAIEAMARNIEAQNPAVKDFLLPAQ